MLAAINQYSILCLLVVAMIGFIWGHWRYDIVALTVLMLAVLLGAVSTKQVFIGLANPAVITVACVMVLSQSITNSGVLNYLIQHISRLNKSFSLYLFFLSLLTALLSAFMNNVGALTLMMPVAIKSALKSNHSPSQILLPLALASAMGGLITAIGTPPNLLISAYMQQTHGQPFHLLDFAPVGLSVALAGIVFVSFIGWRFLPDRQSNTSLDLTADIQDYLFEIKLTEGCSLIDATIEHIHESDSDIQILSLIRKKSKRLALAPDEVLEENDILIIETSPKHIGEFIAKNKCELLDNASLITKKDSELYQVVLPPGSRLENRSFKQSRVKSRFQINLLGLSREGNKLHTRLHNVKLKPGDVLLFNGKSELISEAMKWLGLLPLNTASVSLPKKGFKQFAPIVVFIFAVLMTALGIIPIEISFAGAIIFLCLFKVINTQQLYDGIDWPIIILLAAMIPIGNALESTGGTRLLSQYFIFLSQHLGHAWLLGLLLLATMTLSDFMNNAATAIVMGPLALSLAETLHVPPQPFLMAVAVGASCSFLTPIGHQNNILVMGPGGYRFSDYLKIGAPLEILVLCIAIPTIQYFWPI